MPTDDQASFPPLRILLAEDHSFNAKVATLTLTRLGQACDLVVNGLEAIRAVQDRDYDLVFMDLLMPECDGIEATRRIRAEVAPGRQPRIVAMTANALEGDRERCFEVGMDDYISKPVKRDEVAAALARTVAARQTPST
jgi:CheY-like chemotaxis protein